jgi:hypothetical protein
MIFTTVGPYEIGCQETGFPQLFDDLRKSAALVVEDRDANRDLTGDFFCVSVRRGGKAGARGVGSSRRQAVDD